LEESMVVTVKPGNYFMAALLKDPQLRKKLKKVVNWPLAMQHSNFGGVRIEDDLLITKNGCRVLTDAAKDADQIEKIMSGSTALKAQ